MQRVLPWAAGILAIFVVSLSHILAPMGVLVLFVGLGWVINTVVSYVLTKQQTELDQAWLNLRKL